MFKSLIGLFLTFSFLVLNMDNTNKEETMAGDLEEKEPEIIEKQGTDISDLTEGKKDMTFDDYTKWLLEQAALNDEY